jgi:hypothetical protein
VQLITIKRTVRRRKPAAEPSSRRGFRELAHKFLTSESACEFVVEALVFVILLATATWPIVAAGTAINHLL